MTGLAWIVGFASLTQSPAATAADALTFRDGRILLGEVLETDRRGPMLVLVRRSWASTNLADRATAWQKLEAPIVQRAIGQRHDRLTAWRRDRVANPVEGDRILAWIDRELKQLADPARAADSPLMVVKLARNEVKAVTRRPSTSHRMLRLGWLSKLADVESKPLNDLSQTLEGRGFAPGLDEPVSLDGLLPPQLEADDWWLSRRAATELANDPGGRFLRYQGMVLPEPTPGEAPPASTGLSAAISGLKELLGETPVDPLPGKLAELARKGRVGAVVTRLQLAPDLASVEVDTTLWVRFGGDRWMPGISRSASARPEDLPFNAGDGLADDPQVKAAFGLVESLGLIEVPADLKRKSLNMGAATRKALGQARSGLDRELQRLTLSLEP